MIRALLLQYITELQQVTPGINSFPCQANHTNTLINRDRFSARQEYLWRNRRALRWKTEHIRAIDGAEESKGLLHTHPRTHIRTLRCVYIKHFDYKRFFLSTLKINPSIFEGYCNLTSANKHASLYHLHQTRCFICQNGSLTLWFCPALPWFCPGQHKLVHVPLPLLPLSPHNNCTICSKMMWMQQHCERRTWPLLRSCIRFTSQNLAHIVKGGG